MRFRVNWRCSREDATVTLQAPPAQRPATYRDVLDAPENMVADLWLVDPDARTLEAFTRTERGWLLLGAVQGEDTVRLTPFDAVAFGLGALWPPEADGTAEAGPVTGR
jgi:hypothetical protein